MDGREATCGKVILEYIVSPTVPGLSRDGREATCGKAILEYIVSPTWDGKKTTHGKWCSVDSCHCTGA